MESKAPAGPRCSILGPLAAVLALLGQIAFGSILPNPAVLPDTVLFADVPICHAGAPDNPNNGAPAGHAQHGTQCALCPACHALTADVFLPTPPAHTLAPSMALAARQTWPPPARAPPLAVFAAAYPTGPPNLA